MLPFKSNTEIRTEGISPEQDVAVGGKWPVLAATAKAVAVSFLDTFSSLRWKVSACWVSVQLEGEGMVGA